MDTGSRWLGVLASLLALGGAVQAQSADPNDARAGLDALHGRLRAAFSPAPGTHIDADLREAAQRLFDAELPRMRQQLSAWLDDERRRRPEAAPAEQLQAVEARARSETARWQFDSAGPEHDRWRQQAWAQPRSCDPSGHRLPIDRVLQGWQEVPRAQRAAFIEAEAGLLRRWGSEPPLPPAPRPSVDEAAWQLIDGALKNRTPLPVPLPPPLAARLFTEDATDRERSQGRNLCALRQWALSVALRQGQGRLSDEQWLAHRLARLPRAAEVWPAAQAVPPEPAAAPRSEEAQVREDARSALQWQDFDELERQHALYQQVGQRTAAGQSKLVLFRSGIHRVLKGPDKVTEPYHDQLDALTLQWARAHPSSVLAQVLHAEALSRHAWWYRGVDSASAVPPDAWREFDRYTKRALDHLVARKEVVMASSSGTESLLDIGRDAGWQAPQLWAVAQAGLALNLEDEGIYRSVLFASLPRWGGSTVLVDRTIDELARLSAPLYGDRMYAQMYSWAAGWEFKQRLFIDSAASWPRMQAGYEQWLQRYPTAARLNEYAHFACLARDKPVLLDLLERIGPKPDLAAWGSNASRTWETCRRWAAEQ